MTLKLQPEESNLVGQWVLNEEGNVEGDLTCKRISWLTEECLELVQVKGESWTALYRNPDDNSFWELYYPQSELHGGGPPALMKLIEQTVREKYNVSSPSE